MAVHGARRSAPCCEIASTDGTKEMPLACEHETDIAFIAYVYNETAIASLENRHSCYCGCDGETRLSECGTYRTVKATFSHFGRGLQAKVLEIIQHLTFFARMRYAGAAGVR